MSGDYTNSIVRASSATVNNQTGTDMQGITLCVCVSLSPGNALSAVQAKWTGC
jgi:hypothetical protein